MRPFLRLVMVAVAAAAPMACNALVGDYEADLVDDNSISSEPLCKVERDKFTFELDLESDTQLADLTAYYDAANPALVEHLGAVAKSYGDGDPGAGITYIMGAAGVGKSFAARNIIGGFDDTEKCSVKLSDLFYDEKDKLGYPVAQVPDLETIDGKLVFNELPSLEDPSTFELDGLLDAAGCKVDGTLLPVIIIDDLDEVHDTTCAAILKELDEFVLAGATGAGPFLHVIVFGRPEGFYAWLADPEWNEKSAEIVDLFELNAPRYQTAGDLDFRVRGYLDFKNLLDGLEAAGEVGNYVERTTNAVATYPFLTYSLGNLSVGNIAVARTMIPDVEETEEDLKAGMFDDMVVRAWETHGRPEPGSELGGPYLRALEDIAVLYADVGTDGVFAVRSEDKLELQDDDGDSLGEVRVRDVLNRSGVALRTVATSTNARYRFDPFWVHGHLIERYNKRMNPDYTYRNCE